MKQMMRTITDSVDICQILRFWDSVQESMAGNG